jgi:diguanylate cyclase (GGDEF)-like protein
VARPSRLLYERVVRVVAYLFIAAALVVVTVTQSWQQPLIYLLAAAGVVLVVVGQDMLPTVALGTRRLLIEALTMIVFVSILVVLTGGYASPFFVGYLLVVGSASLWGGTRTPLLLAVAASVGYLLAVLITPLVYGSALPADALASVAFILVAIGLVAYVAAVISREQRRSSEAALSLSRFDALTGLYSRSTFERALDQEVLRAGRSGRGFSLLLLDLDALKPVNDRYGHAAGDRLLAAIGDVMRGGVRATDLAARLGGDEFVVILPETDIAGALLVAEKLRHDIARLTLPTNGMMVSSSVSIGVVGFPDDGRGAVELLRRADQAMYQAKRQGKDQTFAYPRPEVAPAGAPEVAVAGSPEVVIEGAAPWETGT